MKSQNKRNSMLVLTLSTTALLSCAGAVSVRAGAGEDVWSASFSEKVLKTNGVNYSSHGDAAIAADAARDEAEAAQLVVTGTQNSFYTIKTSDLKLEGGSDVFSASNIDVYQALYVNVQGLYNGNNRQLPKGLYPDAMLPYDAAVKYGENKIAVGENQSLYFDFNIPFNQKAGLYKGSFKLNANGKDYSIPVTLNVRDLTVNPDISTKALFLDTWTNYLGEYNGSQRMQDLYHKALLKYRVAPSKLVTDTRHNEEDAAYYAEKIVELYNYGRNEKEFGPGADRFTNFDIPMSVGNDANCSAQMVRYVNAIARVSAREKVNFLERAVTYCIDEPEANTPVGPEYCAMVLGWFNNAKKAAANALSNLRGELKNTYGVNDDFVDEMVDSVGKLHNVVTQSYMNKYDGTIDTFCPLFDSYDNPAMVAKYKEINPDERWWYGCVVPMAPYPTYNIDDLGFSPRVLGWLQSYYEVRGNLYWAVDSYAAYQSVGGDAPAYHFQDDYYDRAANYSIAPGEGYLFRPGKRYGIDGPIPTTRITSIRDGLEDYELIEDIKKVYNDVSRNAGVACDATSTIGSIISSVASGTQVSGSARQFETAKKSLLDFAEFTNTGVVFPSYTDDRNGHISYTVFVPNGTTLTVEGATKTSESKLDSGTMYVYSVDTATSVSDRIVFSAKTSDGLIHSLERILPGKVRTHEADEATASALSGDGTFSHMETFDGRKAVQFSLNAISEADSKGYYKVSFQPSYLNEFGKELSEADFNFYFKPKTKGEKLQLSIYVKYADKKAISSELTAELSEGWNSLAWKGLSEKAWDDGAITRIDFRIDNKTKNTALEARDDVYFGGVSMYKALGE